MIRHYLLYDLLFFFFLMFIFIDVSFDLKVYLRQVQFQSIIHTHENERRAV